MRYLDASREPRTPGDEGFYWRLDVAEPDGGEIWSIGMWTARPEVYERSAPKRPLWMSKLNDDSRYHILEIKNVVCKSPEYRKSLHSWDIYEAVLENDIRGINEFWDWRRVKYGK